MTGEKRTETRMRCYNTLCIPYISLHDPPYSHCVCVCVCVCVSEYVYTHIHTLHEIIYLFCLCSVLNFYHISPTVYDSNLNVLT